MIRITDSLYPEKCFLTSIFLKITVNLKMVKIIDQLLCLHSSLNKSILTIHTLYLVCIWWIIFLRDPIGITTRSRCPFSRPKNATKPSSRRDINSSKISPRYYFEYFWILLNTFEYLWITFELFDVLLNTLNTFEYF